jgi:hypothetical protein
MMRSHYVFTPASLKRCLEMAPNDAWFRSLDVPQDGAWNVLAICIGDCDFVIHKEDQTNSPRLILVCENDTPISALPDGSLHAAFSRILRVALGILSPPLRLPPAWTPFHFENFLAFFATPHGVDKEGLRWIAEMRPDASNDVCFWKLTGRDDPIQLQRYSPPRDVYRAIVSHWQDAVTASARQFATTAGVAQVQALEPAIDLEATTFDPVTRQYTYGTWLQHITPEQRRFVEWPTDQSVKLRGPAGSGKTLALELKSLHELYRARKERSDIRLLFATHSWAVAEQVDAALRRLDEDGAISGIDVYPLFEIARSRLPLERQLGSGFNLLGEDSLSGRRLQLERLDSLLKHLTAGDWLTYRRSVSPSFRARVEAPQGSQEGKAFVWDVMMEFSSVLASQRILPGVNGERRYLGIARDSWMMPLVTDAEKRFVFQIYTEYVAWLAQDRLLTVDQIMNDFLNYLETFTWNLLRDREGYDLIFVDELHLFTEQERFVLHYLTRPASEYPRLFMALDPRQAPSEVYAGVSAGVVARGESGQADLDLGQINSVELSTVHRFTSEILSFIQHIHRRYPALSLGPDWEVDIESIRSSAGHGDKPQVFLYSTQEEEFAALARRVDAIQAVLKADERIALIILDSLKLLEYGEALSRRGHSKVRMIQSRDDIETVLRYSRKSLIVGAAEYLAGLQFDYVVISGFPNSAESTANVGYQQRRLLTALYLAVSRATRHVEIHVNDENGGLPKIVEEALAVGIVERRSAVVS